MEITSNAAMEPNFSIITGLSLNKLAQTLWPKTRANTITRARRIESLRVTAMAFLAALELPAPNSFDTLVLLQLKFWLLNGMKRLRNRGVRKNITRCCSNFSLTLQLHWDHKWTCRQLLLYLHWILAETEFQLYRNLEG